MSGFGAASDRRSRGEWAERIALEHLRKAGLSLLRANFRCRGGEIDLVMRDADFLVFVEVRYRAREDFGGSIESIDERKRARVTLAAEYYLAGRGDMDEPPCRFDVVCVGPHGVEWIRDAFQR